MAKKEREAKVNDQAFVWEIPWRPNERREEQSDIWGTLVLDVDGTLTRPGRAYAIEGEAIEVLANFLTRGGSLIFCSGATQERIERSILQPLFFNLEEQQDTTAVNELFKRVVTMPENGSAILLYRGVYFKENEVCYNWYRLHELHVPNKEALRKALEKELLPKYEGSYFAGDHPDDRLKRDYILSVKDLKNTWEIKKWIESKMARRHKKINWKRIAVKAARTTIDLVHADSGKTFSVAWVLQEIAGLSGPVLGFGDLGDEFAKVIPTINVNQEKPNEFRLRGMPAMELTGDWRLLKAGDYVLTGQGASAIVRDRETGEPLTVLRDERGEIIFAGQENDYLQPVFNSLGHPVEIWPLTYEKKGQRVAVGDAGVGTAWIIRRLMAAGYFDASQR